LKSVQKYFVSTTIDLREHRAINSRDHTHTGDEAQLADLLKRRFGPGAVAEHTVRALNGLLSAAPELLLTQAGL
jgi:hypothetical protein